jgi:hypothetical protein
MHNYNNYLAQELKQISQRFNTQGRTSIGNVVEADDQCTRLKALSDQLEIDDTAIDHNGLLLLCAV